MVDDAASEGIQFRDVRSGDKSQGDSSCVARSARDQQQRPGQGQSQSLTRLSLCDKFQTQYGGSALMIAAENGHATCVGMLIGAPNIDVNFQDEVPRFPYFLCDFSTLGRMERLDDRGL